MDLLKEDQFKEPCDERSYVLDGKGGIEEGQPKTKIPYCHLFYDGSAYVLRFSVNVPNEFELAAINYKPDHIDKQKTCGDNTVDQLHCINVHLVGKGGASGGLRHFRVPDIFNGKPMDCKHKVAVTVKVDGHKKGKTVIRTLDADNYGG